MHRSLIAAILAWLASGLAGAQQLTPRAAGLWQIDFKTTMSPIGGSSGRSEKLCVTAELAARDVAPPIALEEDGWKCRSGLAAAGREKASYAIECRKDGDRARGTGELVLSGPKEFGGRSRIEADIDGMKVVVASEYRGRFVAADCGQAPPMKWEGVTETPRARK